MSAAKSGAGVAAGAIDPGFRAAQAGLPPTAAHCAYCAQWAAATAVQAPARRAPQAGPLRILVGAPPRGMPNGDDDALFDGFINRVVHKIWILPGHDLAHALDGLPPSDLGPQNEILQRIEDGAARSEERR